MIGRVHVPSSSRLLLTLGIVAAFGLSAAGAWAAAPETVYVGTTADSGSAATDCASSTNTDCRLRDAIALANTDGDGDTIVFNSGVTGTITLGSSLPAITVSVTITGPGANLLTISGGNSYQIMSVNGSGKTVSISGLTFIKGPSASLKGGAIYLQAGTLTVSDCVFSGNAAQNGGAIASDGTQLTVTGSTFTQNSAANHGGAIYISAGTLTATNNTFYGNSATSGGQGGAIGAAATVNATNNTFYGNSANYGGAIDVTSAGSLTSDNNLFVENSANGGGAGIYNGSGGTANGDSNVYYSNLVSSSEDDCNTCTSNTNATSASSNPLALPLGNYGGPTQTYLPQPGSAAICAGSSGATNLPAADQRGFAMVNTCVDAGAVQSNYIEVTTGGDSNGDQCPDASKCSLRKAIGLAAGQGDIDFNSSVSSVTLSSTGTLTLSLPTSGVAGVNIIGPGANALTVDGGGGNFSVFTVAANVPAVLYGMTISNGKPTSGSGGGINNSGSLSLFSSAVTGNTASAGDGGGIYNSGSLLALDDTISGNTSGSGGGVYSTGALEIVESTVSGNSVAANGAGGGINSHGTLMVVNSTIAENSASGNTALGGGLYVASGSASLANTIVSKNTVGTTGGLGSNIQNSYTDNGGNVIGGSTDATTDYPGGDNTKPKIALGALGYYPSTATIKTQIPLPGGTGGNPAICAGLSTNLPAGIYTDERGEPNENTTYSGYSANTPCVDAGAVQTNYSMSFTTSPSSVTVDQTFGGVVTLNESGSPFAGADIPVTLSSGTLNGTTTETTDSSGNATYSGLYTTAGTGLTLNASLPLTATLSLSATSSPSFDVTAAPTQVALAASTSSPTANQTVTFTATVSPNVTTNFVGAANVTTINGNVEFDDSGTAISGCSSQAVSYSNSSYVATCSTAALTGGAHSNITAVFTPSDTNYKTSPASTAVTVTVAQATTTTSVANTSNNNPSNVNDSVTFTATVTASAGDTVPLSGQVTFTDNSNAITSCGTNGVVTVGSWNSTNGTATAVCTTSALTGGKHTIVATYSNDPSYSGSNNNLTQTVNAIATTTAATANPTSATLNQSVALSATVTPNGQPVPLVGPVTFTEGGNAVPGCTVTWDASTGAASCSTTQLAVGQHNITATYPADASYNTSSNSVTVNVGAATGTMSLSASPSTQTTVNQQVTFTASFTVQNGSTHPSGQIEFSYTPSGSNTPTDFSGCSQVGLSSTSNGNTKTYTATCSSSSLANGTYTINATYINDSNFSISPATLTQTVGPAPTTTQVTSSSSTSTVNQSVTFTATVSSQVSGNNTPSGTVSFTDTINNATTTLCSSVSIASGVYTCSTSSLVAGTHTITANFSPSNTDFKSSSGTVTQTVTAASSTIGLTAQPAAIIVKNPNNINDSATFTATVKVNGNSNKPAGDISFSYNGALPIPECPVAIPVDANGTATCTTTSLPAGLNTVNAAYSGDNNFKSSNFSVSEAVQDYSIGINAVPTAGGSPETGTVKVTQGYTSSSDPFAPLTISITPTTIQGFSGSLGLTCAVTVDSAPSGSVAPTCNLATSTLAVATSGTQQSADVVVDATKADPGLYTMTVTGADSTTGLAHTTSINIFVSATGGPLNIVSGSTTGNQAAVNFLLPANVSLSNLLCVSVSGTGIQPPGVPPSTLSISCSFDPTTIAAASTEQSGTVTVTVTTSGSSSTTASNSHMNSSHTKLWAAGLFGLPLFGLVGLLRGRKSPRSVFFRVIAILALCTAAYQVTGCGGSFQKPASSGGQTPPGSYTMLIQGTGSDGHTYQAILRLNITL